VRCEVRNETAVVVEEEEARRYLLTYSLTYLLKTMVLRAGGLHEALHACCMHLPLEWQPGDASPLTEGSLGTGVEERRGSRKREG